MAPIIIALVSFGTLSPLALGVIIVSLTGALALWLIEPAKGAVIALQWWFGMHGFKQERYSLAAADAQDSC